MENSRMEDMTMTEPVVKQWNGFAASIPGFGHIRNEVPCQDASSAILSPRPAVIVCDGRGSAKLSHFGARGAVKMFASQSAILEPLLSRILDSEEDTTDSWDKFCQIMYRTLMQVKLDLAAEHQTEEKEFDFTAAFAVAGQYHIGCFQVGDGSIVLRQDGECITAFEPDKGEFANQTHFLREGGERNGKYHAALFDARVNSGIAVTSDGPQFKMFRLADMMPGEIFRHLFDDLLAGELERRDVLTYLTRNDWNTDPRGSDDRSLALLARIGEMPAVEPVVLDASEPVSENTPGAEEKRSPESESKPEKTADVSLESSQECNAGMGVQTKVSAAPAEAKKKRNPLLGSGCCERSDAGTSGRNDLPAETATDNLAAESTDTKSEAETRPQETKGTGSAEENTASASPAGYARRKRERTGTVYRPRCREKSQSGHQRKTGRRKRS